MTLPDFLQHDPDGEIHLKDHRIGLYHVMYYYKDGHSPEMLACRYPTLPLALIHKVIAFCLENQVEADAYFAEYQAKLQRDRGENPRRLEVEQLRERLAAMQRS